MNCGRGELNEMLSSKLDLHGKLLGQQQQKEKPHKVKIFPCLTGNFSVRSSSHFYSCEKGQFPASWIHGFLVSRGDRYEYIP